MAGLRGLEVDSDQTGPAAFGWLDQCWTLARIAELVRRRFGVDYTLAELDLLLRSKIQPTCPATVRRGVQACG